MKDDTQDNFKKKALDQFMSGKSLFCVREAILALRQGKNEQASNNF